MSVAKILNGPVAEMDGSVPRKPHGGSAWRPVKARCVGCVTFGLGTFLRARGVFFVSYSFS